MTPTKKAAPRKATAKRTTTKRTSKRTTAKEATPDKLRAVETFVADVDGDPMIVHAGEVVSAKHAVVIGVYQRPRQSASRNGRPWHRVVSRWMW